MIFDGFTLVGDSLAGRSISADQLASSMESVGIDRAIICPARPPGYHLGPANDYVAAAARTYPGQFVAFGRVDPQQGEQAIAEARRAFTDLGLRGLFLHPWEETFAINSPLVDELVAVAAQYDRPVLVAAGYPWVSEGLQLGELAGRFPDVTFIATNGGQFNISGLGTTDVLMALQAHSNIILQTAGVYREDFLEEVVAQFGSDRLVFATGAPIYDPKFEILRVKWAHFQESERERILGRNIASLVE